jgi:hypothetical protein
MTPCRRVRSYQLDKESSDVSAVLDSERTFRPALQPQPVVSFFTPNLETPPAKNTTSRGFE